MRPRRPNPRAPAPWVDLFSQSADQGQPWRRVGGPYSGLDVAVDEAVGADPRPAPGTVFRAADGSKTLWLGVADRFGAVVDVPPIPPRPRFGLINVLDPSDWFDGWEGEGRSARWMLYQCGGVDRATLTLATCAVARLAMERVSDDPMGDAVSEAALEAAESWALGTGGLDELKALRADAVRIGRLGPLDQNSQNARGNAMIWAAILPFCEPQYAAGNASHAAEWTERCSGRYGRDGEYMLVEDIRRSSAMAVEAWIPLGAALLATVG